MSKNNEGKCCDSMNFDFQGRRPAPSSPAKGVPPGTVAGGNLLFPVIVSRPPALEIN